MCYNYPHLVYESILLLFAVWKKISRWAVLVTIVIVMECLSKLSIRYDLMVIEFRSGKFFNMTISTTLFIKVETPLSALFSFPTVSAKFMLSACDKEVTLFWLSILFQKIRNKKRFSCCVCVCAMQSNHDKLFGMLSWSRRLAYVFAW